MSGWYKLIGLLSMNENVFVLIIIVIIKSKLLQDNHIRMRKDGSIFKKFASMCVFACLQCVLCRVCKCKSSSFRFNLFVNFCLGIFLLTHYVYLMFSINLDAKKISRIGAMMNFSCTKNFRNELREFQ
jgi:hypothetical protein